MDNIILIKPSNLAEIIRSKCEKVLIVDARTFCEFNTSHILNAVNVWCSKIRKKRLQQSSISVYDFLQQACHISLQEISFEEVIVYDQCTKCPNTLPQDTFLYVLLVKLASAFKKVQLLQGGFLEFQSQYYEMCEDSSQKGYLLTSFSQPCLPVSTSGPTKILPFLFLGSQHDANNKQLLLEHNISYELNVSTSCPKPEFLQDSHFLRIAVNDNFSAKLLPYFGEAFRFIEKVREAGGRVLVHCLAGISRSPTIVISYVMKYFHMHYDEAYRYVKTRRPTISPNINFVGQLLEFDLHLFGKRAVMRSPLRPIHVDENFDLLTSFTTASANSPLLKSSSSSCISSDSPSESCFPFPLNRSLPSLRLNKSAEEVKNTSSDFECFPFDEAYKSCSSSKLPSSPVSPPSTPIEGPLSPGSEPDKGPFIDKIHEGGRRSPCNSVNKENEGHVNRGRVPGSSREILVTQSRSCRLCEKVVFSKKESFDEDEEIVDSPTIALTNSSKQPLPINKSESILIITDNSKTNISPPHTQLKRESSAPENSCRVIKEDALTLPPKTIRSCSSTAATRKIEQHHLPHLPRSYSSSETYLNTRMRLEKQQASACSNVAGSNTRKSFSSDEVGRAFQGACTPNGPPPIPPSAGFHKDSYPNPLELVRCDSWSTSGLGSEISDWDSVQGDIQSVEDAQGPFDAVFAEVFPGEIPGSTIFRKHHDIEKPDDKFEMSDQKICLRKTFSDNQNNSSVRKCCSTLLPPDQDSIGASPAPRPVSLPGVSGTYNVADSNSCSDMGVELEDHRDWSTEEVDKLGTDWEETIAKRGQVAFDEHPPVNPKTMGDNVKHFRFHLAQELMQSMEDLLEREISDIKERASSLSKRFGLHLPSGESKMEGLEQFPPKKEVCISPTADVIVEHVVETKEANVDVKDVIWVAPGTHVRSRSEPPSCVEECLYRVKSCPGITNCKGMEKPGKTSRIIKEFDFPFRFTSLFRTSKPGQPTSKRYSCSALDFVVNPSIHSFDSCPDVSRARNKGTPESLTPSSSFNRLLKVS